MSEQTEKLIETVRKYPYLFDSSHELYKNVQKKADAWNEIAEEMNMTNEAARTKWRNLRDSYLRYKKSMNGETGHARKYCKWPWSSQMSFLDASQSYRSQSFSVKIETEDHSPSPEPMSPLMNTNEESVEMPTTPPPKKKVKTNISDVDKVINYLNERKSMEHQIDRIDYLFLSYAATFKSFRPRTQAMLKAKLATLFSETELSEIQDQESACSTSSFSNNSFVSNF